MPFRFSLGIVSSNPGFTRPRGTHPELPGSECSPGFQDTIDVISVSSGWEPVGCLGHKLFSMDVETSHFLL